MFYLIFVSIRLFEKGKTSMTQIRDERAHIAEQGMYDSSFEHDNCGIGAVVNIKGIKTHKTVSDALRIVENLEHRAGKEDRKSVV